MRSVMNSSEVWIPSSVPSAIVWMHVVIVWIVESGISIITIVPRVIKTTIPTVIPSAIVPRVISVIPWIVITSVVSSIVATIVPRIISVTPWVVVSSIAPWAGVIIVIPRRIPIV